MTASLAPVACSVCTWDPPNSANSIVTFGAQTFLNLSQMQPPASLAEARMPIAPCCSAEVAGPPLGRGGSRHYGRPCETPATQLCSQRCWLRSARAALGTAFPRDSP